MIAFSALLIAVIPCHAPTYAQASNSSDSADTDVSLSDFCRFSVPMLKDYFDARKRNHDSAASRHFLEGVIRTDQKTGTDPIPGYTDGIIRTIEQIYANPKPDEDAFIADWLKRCRAGEVFKAQ